MERIEERVRQCLEQAGISQKSLAEKVGMTPDALSRALNGQRGFAAVELADIANCLSADIHYLIAGEPNPLGPGSPVRYCSVPVGHGRFDKSTQESPRITEYSGIFRTSQGVGCIDPRVFAAALGHSDASDKHLDGDSYLESFLR